MRPSPKVLQLAACLSSITPLAAAWPSWLPQGDSLAQRDPLPAPAPAQPTVYVEARQEATKPKTTNLNTAKVEEETKTASADDSEETEKSKDEDEDKDKDKDEDKDSKDSKSDDDEDKDTSKDSKKKTSTGKKHKTFNPVDPPGGVVVMTPATTQQATPLYKIGDYVTFGWNYTSLQGDPTAVDVLVSCSVATQTWTLTSNMTFATKASLVWDTENDADVKETPLLTEMYTLIIKDSDSSITDMAEPGYLDVFSGLKFGMYAPQPYTPLADWTCAGCNAAISEIERHALGFTVTMTILTVASFTWFVTGLGLH